MAYIVESDMYAYVTAGNLLKALDDTASGSATVGLFDNILAAVTDDIDGRCRRTFSDVVPLPPLIKQAAIILTAELLWNRRPIGTESNPWTKRADTIREQLDRIGRGVDILSLPASTAYPTTTAFTNDGLNFSDIGQRGF